MTDVRPRETSGVVPQRRTARDRWAVAAALVVLPVLVADLVISGRTFAVPALILAAVVAVLLIRRPLVVIPLWIAVTPFVVSTSGGGLRLAFWAVHRALPVIALALVVTAQLLRENPRPLPRLRWPELAMAGYVVVSALSILHTSDAPQPTLYHLYDRVFIPMCLYLLVRLQPPDARDLRTTVPVLVFLLISQTVIGVVSWIAPAAVPAVWSGLVGERTTGSLVHPNVFATTLLFAGLLLAHVAMSGDVRRRTLLAALFPVALLMVLMTYSRASWLAGVVVIAGLFAVYRRFAATVAVTLAVVLLLVVQSGLFTAQVQMALDRSLSATSERSALSRLPVVQSSVRMLASKPVVGWGYGNFDRYSPSFQRRVGRVYQPARHHASHNQYLTILAEQGLLGFGLYAFPVAWWLARSRRAYRRLPITGLLNRKLLAVLWLVAAAHFVVNNYSNMRIVFGLGIWWLTLGMIASLVTRAEDGPSPLVASPATMPRTEVAT